jgi:hypothetical protein
LGADAAGVDGAGGISVLGLQERVLSAAAACTPAES